MLKPRGRHLYFSPVSVFACRVTNSIPMYDLAELDGNKLWNNVKEDMIYYHLPLLLEEPTKTDRIEKHQPAHAISSPVVLPLLTTVPNIASDTPTLQQIKRVKTVTPTPQWYQKTQTRTQYYQPLNRFLRHGESQILPQPFYLPFISPLLTIVSNLLSLFIQPSVLSYHPTHPLRTC